jgi:hypothetical protein
MPEETEHYIRTGEGSHANQTRPGEPIQDGGKSMNPFAKRRHGITSQ